MAVFNEKCGNYRIKINQVDHLPPHCHVNFGGRNVRVRLSDLAIMNPPPHEVPTTLHKCLRKYQTDMLKAWDEVIVLPSGKATKK